MSRSPLNRRQESESSTDDSSSDVSNLEEESGAESLASNSEEESGDESQNHVKHSIEIGKLYAAISDERFADVILTTKDNKEIKSHRNILGHFSEKFAKIIESSSEIPVRIAVNDFEAAIVEAALEFLYGQVGTLKGKENMIQRFADEYEIEELKKAFRPPIPRPTKRPMSAYMYFLVENREKIRKQGMGLADAVKACGEKWRSLSTDEKIEWEKMAEDDKHRYETEMTEYFNQ